MLINSDILKTGTLPGTSKKFHCVICSRVGGKDGYKYKCPNHLAICSECIEQKGFFTKSYICKGCGLEAIDYEWDDLQKCWQ